MDTRSLLEDSEATEQNGVTGEERALLEEEEEILSETVTSLRKQLEKRTELLESEDRRSRELTAELVAASRDEDKQMLASDEAVSHALKTSHLGESKSLDRLLEKPYFARFVIEEEQNGRTTSFQYKLGHSSNPECRIIDWRKSPLAKIYYEYQEDDEYSEVIQGREREGVLTVRNPVQIGGGELRQVTNRHGTFQRKDGEWIRATSRATGGIKSVLPLITREQFQTITEDAKTAILIQGIAGSGKTTVALHRLAWLLHERNSESSPEACAVIVRTEVLARFIRHTLSAIEIEDVPVYTYTQWREKVVRRLSPTVSLEEQTHGERGTLPKGFTVLLFSEQFFELFEKELRSGDTKNTFWELLHEVLKEASEKNLFQALGGDIKRYTDYIAELAHGETVPEVLGDCYLRYLMHRETLNTGPLRPPVRFEHLVIDELQDYALLSLSCLMSAVKESSALTLVGDVGQALSDDYRFIGWQRLQEVWNIDIGEQAKFFTLQVSHRSSLPIMQLASAVAERPKVAEGHQGRTPIWFHRADEQDAVGSLMNWLEKAIERYPDAITAVLCRDHESAREVYEYLKPTFGGLVRLGTRYSFSFEEGIVVAPIDAVKGLEFTNVVIWNPSQANYPKSEPTAKNRMYVAMTRAEENLCLVGWGRASSLLPSRRSKLVRVYDYRDEQLEENEK
ncbi:AAA family ATPase [bacterium]|nr:AAA family ATPase [bacterium]